MDLVLNENEILNCLLILIPESITPDKYKKSIYLLVKELCHLNKDKYNLILYIAEKAFHEVDPEIFEYNYLDLKNELKIYL